MPLKSIVKVSHITNLSDARYCAGMGVEMLGFRVIPGSEHYIPPAVFQEIRGWISGPKIVAELYGITSQQDIGRILESYSPDYVELTWDEYKLLGRDLTLPCIVYITPSGGTTLFPAGEDIVYFLVDESTKCTDIASIHSPVLINIRSLQRLQIKASEGCYRGFNLESPREQRPGITNTDQLGEILEALEED